MGKFSKAQVIKSLKYQWGSFVEKYNSMSAEEQQQYLNLQGYARLGDLLAHIAAWWQRGMQVIMVYRRDPGFQPPNVDVDAFNAEAVASVKKLSEAEIISHFENRRFQMLELVKSLNEVDLQSERIKSQLAIEVIEHFQEHH
ncbi:MAG: hypothetical protein CVU42_15600 [Chloroflexi bacterium HGW-Chloroflexi-4]|jgi:hypothetical protein|nr:MAG: hypothetical protein CVU45_06805 [Chloroflexi bacterium HGW-Chloroflexi-7]PKN97567.1 MAG: hypothetical protein CVU42_15600 [Chloroflexi bacterium HGW-Chloroflexi-4]